MPNTSTREPKRKTLAELRKSQHVGPMERSTTICVAGALVAEYEELDTQYRIARESAPEHINRRVSDGPDEARRIAELMEPLHQQMLEHEVVVRLRRKPRTTWRREYVEAHPPRIQEGKHTAYCHRDPDDEDACSGCLPNLDDARHGVNIDDLADDVGEFVVALNGEPADRDDYDEIVAASASNGDLRRLARIVATMHEGEFSVPKSRLALHNEEMSSNGSEQPAPSE